MQENFFVRLPPANPMDSNLNAPCRRWKAMHGICGRTDSGTDQQSGQSLVTDRESLLLSSVRMLISAPLTPGF
jgi:hypothetical protein